MNRPDVVPAVAPVFDNFKASDTSIYLHWIVSSSNDVIRHTLYRREKGLSDWQSLMNFDNEKIKTSYVDTSAQKLKFYEYLLTATDNGMLESKKENVLTLSLIDYGFRPSIEKISGKPDRLQKQILLTWQYTSNPDKFYIYRSANGDPLRHYKTIAGQERNFTDKDLTINTKYTYRIKAIYLDGGQSKLTQPVSFQY